MVRQQDDLARVPGRRVAGGFGILSTIPELRAAVLGVPRRPGGCHHRATARPIRASPSPSATPCCRRSTIPNDPIYKEFQWGLRKIGMEAVWDVTTGSPNVIVAVLDTGVDEAHPDLEPNVLDGYDFVQRRPETPGTTRRTAPTWPG